MIILHSEVSRGSRRVADVGGSPGEFVVEEQDAADSFEKTGIIKLHILGESNNATV